MIARNAGAAVVAAGLLLFPPAAAHVDAQAVRGDVDVRMQSVAFERFDGTPTVDLVRAAPLVGTLDLTAWDLGVDNLSVHLRTSVTSDLADDGVWPSTEPPLRLIEGYLEYSLPKLTARAGRTWLHTRLGYESFDGARLDARPIDFPLTVTAFGGWSLARGSTLPLTSPDGNPLGEFRPGERGVVLGGAVRATVGPVRGSAVYRREVDTESSKLASEFVALSANARIGGGVSLAAGADYDLGFEEWGSADARLDWAGQVGGRQLGAGVSVRRYRPRFPLWSIWGAFSPVPYTATAARASISPFDHLTLRGTGERFTYGDPETSSPLVSFEDEGWRWTAGAGWTGLADWSFDTAFGAEFGPGASSTHARVSTAWRPVDDVRAGAWLARGTRPLEYRIDDAVIRSAGLDLSLDVGRGITLDGGVAWFDEERRGGLEREFDHWRVRAGVRYGFGTSADRVDLHPAILRIPERPDR